MNQIKEKIQNYLIKEFFNDPEAGQLTDTTPLISSGIIDSISALQMVEFIEKEFNFEFKAHEVDQDHLDTLEKIVAFVEAKVGS